MSAKSAAVSKTQERENDVKTRTSLKAGSEVKDSHDRYAN
jgi:hypothetical protein